jgi:hypothetical protein
MLTVMLCPDTRHLPPAAARKLWWEVCVNPAMTKPQAIAQGWPAVCLALTGKVFSPDKAVDHIIELDRTLRNMGEVNAEVRRLLPSLPSKTLRGSEAQNERQRVWRVGGR